MEGYILFTQEKTIIYVTNNTRVSVDNHNESVFFNWRYSWLEVNGSLPCDHSSVRVPSISWPHYTLWPLSPLRVLSSIWLSAEEREQDENSLSSTSAVTHHFHTYSVCKSYREARALWILVWWSAQREEKTDISRHQQSAAQNIKFAVFNTLSRHCGMWSKWDQP